MALPPSGKYRPPLALFAAACFVALISASPYCTSWNDGSRLAAVQSLVDFHTWQIDQSAFQPGTADKTFINGHYYSDKPPVTLLALAGIYKFLQMTMGLKAISQPRLFCYLMALFSSGTAYIFSVLCMDRLVALAGLFGRTKLVLVGSFAFGTILLVYTRAVNNHILILAVVVALFLLLARTTEPGWKKFSSLQLAGIGTLLGVGYTTDLGLGPVLVICTVVFLSFCTRSLRSVGIVLSAAFPWFALHHALNYMLGGGFWPMDSVEAFYHWPGSPFVPNSGPSPFLPDTFTGQGFEHASFSEFLAYGTNLMLGRGRGFLLHNPTLFLAVPAAVVLLWKRTSTLALAYFSIALIAGTWLLYAAMSNNYSGKCVSVRWLLPLLIPFYYILIVFLKHYPSTLPMLIILSFWSVILAVLLWLRGPWSFPLGRSLLIVDFCAFVSTLVYWQYQCVFHYPVPSPDPVPASQDLPTTQKDSSSEQVQPS